MSVRQLQDATVALLPDEPPEFAVRVRGFVDGCSCTRTVGGLVRSMSVRQLQDAVVETFAAAWRPRLFLGDQELERQGTKISWYGVGPSAVIFAQFRGGADRPAGRQFGRGSAGIGPTHAVAASPAHPPPEGAASSSAGATAAVQGFAAGGQLSTATAASLPSPDLPDDAPLDICAQGVLHGTTARLQIEGLLPSETILDLERRVAAAFGSGSDMRLRLIYLGRELRDSSLTMIAAGLKSDVVVQVLFVPGRPRHESVPSAPHGP